MKIATWNVNSVRSRLERLLAWLQKVQPDVLCLQELKVTDETFPYEPILKAGYHAAVYGQKTYNGVAILSRVPSSNIQRGIGDAVDDPQARFVLADVGGVYIASVYVPNGQVVGSEAYAYKLQWLARLRMCLERQFTSSTPLVICGDFNVARDEKDVARPDVWASSVLSLAALRLRGVLSKPSHRTLPPTGRSVRLSRAQEEYLAEWRDLHPELLALLGEERNRNRQILETICQLDTTWPTLFFGCSVQHAEAMAVLLRRRGREAAAITADTRDATRRHLVDAFRHGQIQVLCNYGVLTTGFDAPRVRAVVIGRPTASRVLYDQMIGRGMRGPRFGGTEECLVIDVDANLVHFDGKKLTTAGQQYAEYWTRQ